MGERRASRKRGEGEVLPPSLSLPLSFSLSLYMYIYRGWKSLSAGITHSCAPVARKHTPRTRARLCGNANTSAGVIIRGLGRNAIFGRGNGECGSGNARGPLSLSLSLSLRRKSRRSILLPVSADAQSRKRRMGRNFRNDARGIGCEGLIAARGKRGTGTRSIRSLEIARNRDALAFAEGRRKTTRQEGGGSTAP